MKPALVFLGLAFAAVLAACSSNPETSLTDEGETYCVRAPDGGGTISLAPVDCGEPGVLRVTRVVTITEFDEYPGEATIDAMTTQACPSTSAAALAPTEKSWNEASDRQIICLE